MKEYYNQKNFKGDNLNTDVINNKPTRLRIIYRCIVKIASD